MRLPTSALLVLCTLFLTFLAGPADARNILIDESHDQQWPFSSDGRFTMARAELVNAGHTLSTLSGVPGAITAAALLGQDVFYTGTLNQPLTAGEINALQDFVSGGGGVIVGHDGGWASDGATPSVNTFLAPYGVEMAAGPSFPSGLAVTGYLTHCATAGVQAMGLDYLREISNLAFPAVALNTGFPTVWSVTDVGSGWVMVLGDDSLWTNPGAGADFSLLDLDNLQVLHNVFGYEVCGPVSVEAAGWSQIKALYR